MVSEYVNLEAATDAAEADTKVLLRPILVCQEGSSFTDEDADCFADGIADRFNTEDLGAEELVTISRFASPEDRRALSALSLVCQGAAPEVAECMVEQMAVEYPRMFEQERMV